MLRRKIMNDLLYWKDNHINTCLLVYGASGVGKTYIIREFAKCNYDKIYEFDFLDNSSFKKIFSVDLSAGGIINKMSLIISDFEIVKGKTLLFLDNIQECPEAITALKFLAQDNSFDVIASGNMLGTAYCKASSFPVGYLDRIHMYSLDFEEFLWAMGISDYSINHVKNLLKNNENISLSIHESMLDLFKKYIVVGGMPEVVLEFISSNNYDSVLKVQRKLLDSYKSDILKYAPKNLRNKINLCFDSISLQLSKKNKKFKYSLFDKRGIKDKYYNSLMWLYDAGLINFCYNLSIPEAPLEGNKIRDCFKVYINDTGLLVAMLDDGSNDEIMAGNLGIYKGAIYENVIAEVFTKLGKNLYYFEKNSTLEIDFFIRYNNVVTAVEVKSADNTKSKSLNSVINNYGVKADIKLSSKNLGTNKENIISLPIYMSAFFD